MTGRRVVEGLPGIESDGPLDFDEVWDKYEKMLDWVVATYVEALNIIHYCHDRYAYEAIEISEKTRSRSSVGTRGSRPWLVTPPAQTLWPKALFRSRSSTSTPFWAKR